MLNNLYSCLERSWILSATIGDLSSRLTGLPVQAFYRFYFESKILRKKAEGEYSHFSNISFANKVKWLVSCKIWKANLDLYSDWWTVSEISPYGQMQHKNKIPKIMRTHTCREFRSFPKFLTRRKSDYRPGCPLCTDYISILISSMEQAVKTGFQGHSSNFLHFTFLIRKNFKNLYTL